jgi:hypothetical protein
MLDSGQPGERQNAFEKIHTLRTQHGFPLWRDVLEQLENTVPLSAFQVKEAELAKWINAHDQLARNNAALARQNAAMRVAVRLQLNWRRIGQWGLMASLAGATVMAVGVVGYYGLYQGGRYLFSLWPRTDPAAISAKAAEDRLFREAIGGTRWGDVDTAPVVARLGGDEWWIIVRGYADTASHTDAFGKPVKRECLRLFAIRAETHGGAYLTPHPYSLFGYGWLTWPERVAECRTPGRDGRIARSYDD